MITGDQFLSVVNLLCSIWTGFFNMTKGMVIVSTSPALTLYGLIVFVIFMALTADFIRQMRS